MQPDHKAAREYLGELYVETGHMEKAKEQLAVLTKLCPGGCDEREDLQKAIADKKVSFQLTHARAGATSPVLPFWRIDDDFNAL